MKMSDVFELPVSFDIDLCKIHSPSHNLIEAKAISLEAQCYAINNHDRLAQENEKLRQEKETLLHELCSIQNACIGKIAMGYELDAENIGHDISIATGMTNPELNELLKDQNNDK